MTFPAPIAGLFRRALAALAMALLALCGTLEAQDAIVPASLQAGLFLKLAAFDRKFPAEGRGEIVIGILYQSRSRESLDVKEEFERSLAGLSEKKIATLPLRWVTIDWSSGGALDLLLGREHIDILFVTPLRAVAISDISDLARARGIRTWSSVPSYVEKGLAVGMRLLGDRPEILVNLSQVRAEGSDFSSRLLKLARLFP